MAASKTPSPPPLCHGAHIGKTVRQADGFKPMDKTLSEHDIREAMKLIYAYGSWVQSGAPAAEQLDEETDEEYAETLQYYADLGRSILVGEYKPVIWNPAMMEAALSGADAWLNEDEGQHIPDDKFPCENQIWVSTSGSLPFLSPDEALWSIGEREIHLMVVTPYLDAPGWIGPHCDIEVLHRSEMHGDFYGGDFNVLLNGPIGGWRHKFIACHCFMQEPFIDASIEEIPRHMKRQAEREGKPVFSPRVVRLRKRERKPKMDSAEQVTWHWQWLVSGHWRRLAQPRKSDGGTVAYVRPHVKGPAGKPLKTPRQTIYAVTR